MDFGINGKKALVCAASKGLGFSIARALSAEGVEVFLCARDEESLKAAAEKLKPSATSPVHYAACDLTSAEGREALIAQVRERMGDPDILINNVGGPPSSMANDTTPQAWQEGFDRLFLSVVQLNRAFLPAMRRNRWGRIVTVTSSSVYNPINGLAVSNALRPAVTALLKNWSDEVAADGVTINCVAPGVIHTDRIEQRLGDEVKLSGGTKEDHMRKYGSEIPAGRMGEPDDFGPVVAFLCSRQAAYVTGVTLPVDGGKHRFIL